MLRTLQRHSPQTKSLIAHIRADLKAHRVRLVFSRTRMVRFDGTQKTVAYFQEPTPRRWGIIRVGTGNRKPVNILFNLLHEYAHFLQWKSGDRQWHTAKGDFIAGEGYLVLERRTEQDARKMLRDWDIPANHAAIRSRSKAYLARLKADEVG